MDKIKEIHVWLDLDGYDGTYPDGTCLDICETMADTVRIINSTGSGRVHTTQLQFLSFDIAEKVFVHVNGEIIEIKDRLEAALTRYYANLADNMNNPDICYDYSSKICEKIKPYGVDNFKNNE